jgi:hypothetical protein
MNADREPQRREPLHQPPDPAGLLRHPPADAVCARVRGLMRDYADSDLAAAERAEIEEHAHACRPCALALVRAEHEVLRLRRAFAVRGGRARRANGDHGAVDAPRPGFARRVVDRLVLDETSMFSIERAAPAVRPSSSGAGSASTAARRGLGRAGSANVPAVPGSVALLFAAVLIGVLVLFGAVILDSGLDGIERTARLVVTRATQSFRDDGSLRLRITTGDDIGEDQTLWVGAGGGAEIDWHDASAKSQPVASLRVGQKGEVRMESGEPMLVNGRVRIETHRPVSIPIADGSRIDLGVGEYIVSAEELATLEGRRPFELAQELGPGSPETLRVAIEVLRGDGAQVLRPMMNDALVSQGYVGIYHGSSAVHVQRSGADDLIGARRRPPAEVPPAPRPSFDGFVYERGGAAHGVDLLLNYANAGVPTFASPPLSPNGRFLVEHDAQFDTGFAIVGVLPSVGRSELGFVVPSAYPVAHDAYGAHLTQAVMVDVSAPLVGIVVDEAERPCFGVRVVPCIVDELFGTSLPLPDASAVTELSGQFVLRRLPVDLPQHQHLSLLLLHPGYQPAKVPVPIGSSQAARSFAMRLSMPALRTVAVHGLSAFTTYQFIEELTGLPSGGGYWQRPAHTDGNGRIQALPAGRGRLWIRANGSPTHPQMRALVLDNPAALTYRPSSQPPQPLHAVFHQGQMLSGSGYYLGSSYRHRHFDPVGWSAGRETRTVVVRDAASNRPVGGAQVFGVGLPGPGGHAIVRFLGFTASTGALACLPGSGESGLCAIAPDGAIGWVELGEIRPVEIGLPLNATGRIGIDASLRPAPGDEQQVLSVQLEYLDGTLPGMLPRLQRFACANDGWELRGIPAGSYRLAVADRTFTVAVPAGGFATIAR